MAMIYYKQLKKWTKLNPKINMMKLPFVLLNMKMSYSLIKINWRQPSELTWYEDWPIKSADSENLKYSETCLKRPLKNTQYKGLKAMWKLNAGQKYCRMLPEHSAVLLTCIKQLSVLKTYFLVFFWVTA